MTERKKKIAPLAIGFWDDKVFKMLPVQPEEPITDMNAMVQWARANIKEPGAYSFVRNIPGKLQVAVQTEMKAILVD